MGLSAKESARLALLYVLKWRIVADHSQDWRVFLFISVNDPDQMCGGRND